MNDQDWMDEAADIVNERFGDDPGYDPKNKITLVLDDGTEIDLDVESFELRKDDWADHNPGIENWGSVTHKLVEFGPISIKWVEVDGDEYERLFAAFGEPQRRSIGAFISDALITAAAALIITIAQLYELVIAVLTRVQTAVLLLVDRSQSDERGYDG